MGEISAADERQEESVELNSRNPFRSTSETQAAFEAFLAGLEQRDQSVTDAMLDADVDALLGRTSKTSGPLATARRSASGPYVLDRDRAEVGEGRRFEWYAKLVATAPYLSDDQVNAAAKAVEAGLIADESLNSSVRTNFTRVEIEDLRTLVWEGEIAWQSLIRSNLRLVFHWSKGVSRSLGPDWAQDAFQAGCIGLIRGLQGWDHLLGYKLSTFVSWHIRQAIQRWRANEILLIRLPVHVWEALDRDPESLSPAILEATKRAREVFSLDELDVDNENLVWGGGMPELERILEVQRIASISLKALNTQEADVLRKRYGFDGVLPMTLDEIGVVYGVTRERIRQIEKKALEKLRTVTPPPSDWAGL